MNCQQFTSFIVEAARGQMMDAALRDGALRHAESCQACGARLAQEQSLTGALRTVALGMKDVSAPARAEAKLMAAFQENFARHNATAATGASTHAPVSPSARVDGAKFASNHLARRRAFAATAIAASLVLVVLAALYLRFTQTAPPSQDLAMNNRTAVSKAAPPDKELTPNKELTTATPLAPSSEPERQPARTLPGIHRVVNQGIASQRATIASTRRHTPTMIKAQHVIDGGQAIIEASEAETVASSASKADEAESVTEFISLVGDAPTATPLESGQLVRVQVPRAALASFGLPVNVERGNEPIKADVLLGGDGLARAIRFVR